MTSAARAAPFDGVIFLPGLLCDERLFAPQLQALKGRYATEVADLGGCDTFEAMAQGVLDQTDFDRFALVGLSMGGALAMNMARWAPHRVARMAILDANPGADDESRRANRRRQIAAAAERGVGQLSRAELAKIYLAPHNRTTELVDLVVAMAERHGLAVYQRQQNALMSRQDSRAHLPEYQGHTLVLCGELDQLCLPKWHREMADLIPNSRLVLVPDAGHLATIEVPDAVNTAVLEWLSH